MEVSSHALDQRRVTGLAFRAAAFTNLTQDHLDYHGTLEAYFEAKSRLFSDHLQKGGVAVVNADDPHGRELSARLQRSGVATWTFSVRSADSALHVLDAHLGGDGIRADVSSPAGRLSVRSPLVGGHNLENILAAAGLALAGGFSTSNVEQGIARLRAVPGRLERVSDGTPAVFVDYAHTDDALRRALEALSQVFQRRVILVFGCGGDRDRGKRALMGAVAGRLAHRVVVTSDNPRSEDPSAIIREIVPGLDAAGMRRDEPPESRGYLVEPNRRRAIEIAVQSAGADDVVLIAGKGHEDHQIVGDSRVHFDDREEARRALAARG